MAIRSSVQFVLLVSVAVGSTGCRSDAPPPRAAALATVPSIAWPSTVTMVGRLTPRGVEWRANRATPTEQVGRVVGDSAVRLRLWPVREASPEAAQQLCGAVATGRVPRLLADTAALPADTAQPALGLRRLTDGDPIGVRWIVPGEQAQYHFEGVTRDGAQRVSFRWPVRADAGVRIPVGAPDSVIEAALAPAPDSLDALMRRVVASAPGSPRAESSTLPAPRQVDAVPLVSDLPFHVVALPLACPTATFRVPMIARVEQRLRLPVHAGDELEAFATAEYGTVQVAFEEAGLPSSPSAPGGAPRARVIAARDGTVTLRLLLQVVLKKQRADQDVLLTLTRRHP